MRPLIPSFTGLAVVGIIEMAHLEPDEEHSHSYEGGAVSDADRIRVLRSVIAAGLDLGPILGMSSDDCDEATQTLAVRMNEDLARFVPWSEKRLHGYVENALRNWKTNANVAEKTHREGNLEATKDHERLFHSQNRPDRPVQLGYLNHRIEDAIDKLPPRQKEVFLLTEEEGLARAEIAAQLGIGEEAVKEHLSRARKRLRELLEDVPRDRVEPDPYLNMTAPSRRTNDADGEEVDHE